MALKRTNKQRTEPTTKVETRVEPVQINRVIKSPVMSTWRNTRPLKYRKIPVSFQVFGIILGIMFIVSFL